jgi:hypothetical protein
MALAMVAEIQKKGVTIAETQRSTAEFGTTAD